MPELPEVEQAAAIARQAVAGRTITSVDVRHRALRRHLPPRAARSLIGDRVERVERRGKVQRFRLASGRELRVHFRMTGDWIVPDPGDRLPRTVRAVFHLGDGRRLALDDPRALSVVSLCAGDVPIGDSLGPEATDRALTAAWLARALARRRSAIKPALLDQRIVAGLGNIYAAEALWRAGLDPRLPANGLGPRRLARLTRAIRETMRVALGRGVRYHGGREPAGLPPRFAVYDREGAGCRRCGGTIRRIVQAGRSTYHCPGCQRK